MEKRSGLAFVFVFVLCLSLFVFVSAQTEKKQISLAAHERFEHLRHTFAIEEEGSDGGEGGHLAPSPSWECDVCEELVKEIVPILNYNRSMGETQFHREMDDLCVRFFADDGWLIGFCQYIVDSNGLEFYEIIVKRQQPQQACALLGYCDQQQRTPGEEREVKQQSARAGPRHNQDQELQSDAWAFVVSSDMHIGQESDNAPWLNRVAIEKINNLTRQENIKMVFITGDITNSAMPEQWTKAKEVLSHLKVPYLPVFGNHDIWSYNSTYEEPYPTGDFKFAATFGDVLADPGIPAARYSYNNKTTYNPEHNINSWFQNWELQYDNFVFYGLDWISRAHAVSQLGYKGGWPGAALQNFPGGTYPWLQQRLEALKNDNKTVVFLQHHPFAMPIYIPEIIYSFSYEDKTQILKLMMANGQQDKYWGVIAGHLHIWFDGQAFPYTHQRQWLTEATKTGSSFTLVKVRDGRIVSLEKLFGYDY